MNDVKERIAEHPFFQGMTPIQLSVAGECASETAFGKDEILFREGEPADRFFLLEAGSIALETQVPGNGVARVGRLAPGEVLGWSWLFPPFVWHLQARALEPVKAIVLSGAHLLIAAERDRAFGFELMKRVSQVVIQRLQAVRREWVALQAQSERAP